MNERQSYVELSKDVPFAIRGGASFVLLLSRDRSPDERAQDDMAYFYPLQRT
ncbi:hypothetical protein H0178_50380 [Cytobacillus firmus]|nr:hypothetical protein [Cytobacillus firmus]